MAGRIASLYRHPVKGFTPERVDEAQLQAGGHFPCDRLYAVENGPSGFDPCAPACVPKSRFTVLASIPKVARARTRFDDATHTLTVEAEAGGWRGSLRKAVGRVGFAAWLSDFLGEGEVRGPLRVVHAAGHRFTDHPQGFVSVVNLASVADLERRTGRAIDPLRFRANLYVDGWPAWSEMGLGQGARVRLGQAVTTVFKPIVRCAAINVDPLTGIADADLVGALFEHYGQLFCGLYLHIVEGGVASQGDEAGF